MKKGLSHVWHVANRQGQAYGCDRATRSRRGNEEKPIFAVVAVVVNGILGITAARR